jgi:hypothetical protein
LGVEVQKSSSIVYFDREGNEALGDVLKILKRTFRKREDLRSHKIVFFTAVGRGPAIAYSQLEEYDPKIIAVTFPPTFTVRHGDEQVCPQIPEKIARYFRGVGIRVITGRLPFDEIEGATTHNQEMTLITNVLSLFGGSFRHCVQAVLQACDAGAVEPGEDVISVTGDCAAVVTAAYTKNFLAKDGGLVIREILCKPRTERTTLGYRNRNSGRTTVVRDNGITGEGHRREKGITRAHTVNTTVGDFPPSNALLGHYPIRSSTAKAPAWSR